MADLNIPKLNKNSDKYLFKKKLTLRRKSKSQLLVESFLMLISSFLLIYLNYLVPNKTKFFIEFSKNLEVISNLIIELFKYSFQIFLAIFVVFSLIFSLVLILGSFYRVVRVIKRKTKKVNYK